MSDKKSVSYELVITLHLANKPSFSIYKYFSSSCDCALYFYDRFLNSKVNDPQSIYHGYVLDHAYVNRITTSYKVEEYV